jgi:hypothetical protein
LAGGNRRASGKSLTADPRITGNLSGKLPSQQASLDRLQARRFGFCFSIPARRPPLNHFFTA